MNEKIIIVDNGEDIAKSTSLKLGELMSKNGFEIAGTTSLTEKNIEKIKSENRKLTDGGADLIVCLGGDGSFLRTLYAFDFPETKIAGINFGHLGFFQEFDKENLNEFVGKYKSGDYVIQEYSPIDARGYTADGIENFKCLNEIAVKGTHAFAVALDVHIAGSKIETFYGDGIVVATAAGSTAYNYALSGSIIDHRLNALQLTPIAPIKSAEFSSFTSGIILPPSETLSIIPRRIKSKEILLAGDGIERNSGGLKKIEISLAKKPISLLRFSNYDFWDMVKRKLL